ncbi:glutamate--cysteine ligase [Aestuariibacter halophilus]|uniref:Glutamate--cysteine ligase n=1 Tax=Fluctibacter halophilus TaxID=226011 RepID=A0ABS8GAJ2_9ALTE|nr:glutamate--cysteine ligase [Aestuariibacter halophilus]MCC2616734.1 glutamate--cysteine ligase [Aestuariibacter halophilus]
MNKQPSSFAARLDVLQQTGVMATLGQIRHGVEREALRINPNGSLAQTPHPQALGAALTHELITTDFSEALLEFITPPEVDPNTTLEQLRDIHAFVHRSLGEERLWPMSMPCFIKHEDDIALAQFGSSNIGKMKTLYRKGLKHRYGSMMQAIAGVHFNFSLPATFWQAWLPEAEGTQADQAAVSAAYFAMIRNYRRWCWIVPLLFGASPALCRSFLQGKGANLPFETIGKGTCYLPYATSLRMSDLGYTNSAQSGLAICYNDIDNYIASLRKAINTPSAEYAKFRPGPDGEFKQLNDNVLQIENELYSPIRPKQPTHSLEKPTDALADRGVSYIEVRALDVDPFSDVGISLEQFYFLDVFLLYCLVKPSATMAPEGFQETDRNLKKVVVEGRKPGLELSRDGQPVALTDWAKELFDDMRAIAAVMDNASGTDNYSRALDKQWAKICDFSLTPSARILAQLKAHNTDNGALGVALAEQYKQGFAQRSYSHYSEAELVEMAQVSLRQQAQIEQADQLSFEAFLADYFAKDKDAVPSAG